MLDVIIIGGGPAGAALAIQLAGSGHAVAVLERSGFPRAKVCGEFIAAAGLQALEQLGVPLADDNSAEVGRIALWADELRLEAPLAPARAVARGQFDTLLLQRAACAGAQLHQPLRALAIERAGRGCFTVVASRGVRLRARAVVAAHGAWERGPLPARCSSRVKRPGDLFGFKAHFRGHRIPPRTIALIPFPGGYAGAVGLGGELGTFACSVRRDSLFELRRRYPGSCAGHAVFRHALHASRALRDALGQCEREGPWLAVGPLRPGTRPLAQDGVFALGNAAGEVHPIVGEGITLALQSALALAAPLSDALENGSNLHDAAEQYRRRYAGLLRRQLWRSRALAALAMSPLLAACGRNALRRMPSLLAIAARR